MFQMKPQDSVIVYTLGKVKVSLRKYYRKYNTETARKKKKKDSSALELFHFGNYMLHYPNRKCPNKYLPEIFPSFLMNGMKS